MKERKRRKVKNFEESPSYKCRQKIIILKGICGKNEDCIIRK
jgi:hypothetical protein